MDDKPKCHPWLKDGEHSSESLPVVADWIVRYAPDCTILDVGCGNGDLLIHLFFRGSTRPYRGLDIESGHVAIARKRIGWLCHVEVADVSVDLGAFASCKFGAIVAVNWLHNDWRACHAVACAPRDTPDDTVALRALKNMRAALAPGGVIIADCRGKESEFLELLPLAGLETICQLTTPHPTYVCQIPRSTTQERSSLSS